MDARQNALFLIVASVFYAGAAGCAGKAADDASSRIASPAGTTQSAPSAETRNAGRRPMMISEAALPEGFPAPGPVNVVVVKQYPAYRAARVDASATGDNRTGDDGTMFRQLFDHIKRNDIAMTAPVEMSFGASTGEAGANNPPRGPTGMSFLYRRLTSGSPGADGDVEVVDLPAAQVVSVSVRGDYEKGFERGLPLLQNWLSQNAAQYRAAGPPRFFGYNSPLVPSFARIGEVQIPVEVIR